jgi:ATP-dependent DNA helicase RecG
VAFLGGLGDGRGGICGGMEEDGGGAWGIMGGGEKFMRIPDDFNEILQLPEGANVEFKEAKNKFGFDELVKLAVAIANTGGGVIVLGVTNKRPRKVVGTSTFSEPGKIEALIANSDHTSPNLRIQIREIFHDQKRVLEIRVPPRSPGMAYAARGAHWMRSGEELVPMPTEQLKLIYSETAPDFSAEICPSATLSDLDATTVAEFRRRWAMRDNNRRLEAWSDEETLQNAELVQNGQITHAALILFGTSVALARHLPHAEIVFEYRSAEAAGPAQDRVEFREGFLLFHDRLWKRVSLRNDRQSYQVGLFNVDILTFDEAVIREGILNAVCHRDYRHGGSVFVRQFQRRIEIQSPGGLPPGVTAANVLDAQNPRNRRLAEAFARCGLVERAGQGMNIMFERSIRQSKPLPELTADENQVRLTLHGNVTNPAFLRFMEKVGEQMLSDFNTQDMLVLDSLQRGEEVPEELRQRLSGLVDLGVVETVGRGRGIRHLISRRYYSAVGKPGVYTRKRGLDEEHNKALLVTHLGRSPNGCPISELQEVLPPLSRNHIKGLLDKLRNEGKVTLSGKRRWARWCLVGGEVYGSLKD